MTSVVGFSDASMFRFENNIPYYSIEGDSYLAKFKNGLCLEDVIEFNDLCDYFSKKMRFEPVAEDQIDNEPQLYKKHNDDNAMEYIFPIKSKISREKRGPKTMKKRMQKYRIQKRYDKIKYIEENGGDYSSFSEVEKELKICKEIYETKKKYKQVMAMIQQTYDYFVSRRLILSSSHRNSYLSDGPWQYFVKNDIIYHYGILNGNLVVLNSYVKIEDVNYYPPTHMYDSLIAEGRYIHKTILMLERAGYYDPYRQYDYEEEYGDYERFMSESEYEMAEYYADF